MGDDLYTQITEHILSKIQENTTCHQKYYYKLLNVFKNNATVFVDSLEKIVSVLLQQSFKTKSIYVDRSINFLVLFCTSKDTNVYSKSNNMGLIYEHISNFLLSVHNVESDTVRYRSCQLISQFLNKLGDVELDQNLYDKISDAMLERLEDSISDIRLQAVYAIYRLQDPTNSDCVVTKQLLKRITDVRPKIRKVCVEKIAVQKQTVKALLQRSRDITIEVRLAAYLRISKLCKCIKIQQRQQVIRNGFFDESERVQSFVKNQLIKTWLAAYDDNFFKFLRALRLDANDEQLKSSVETCRIVLNCLFRTMPWEEVMGVLPLDEEFTIPLDVLTSETAVYLQLLVEFCRKSDELDTFVEALLPDLVVFVKYIQKFCDISNNFAQFEFILSQFFTITAGYDLSDPSSRVALNRLVRYVLTKFDLHENVVETIIKNLEKSITKLEQRENFILEIISDLKYPIGDDEGNKTNSIMANISELKARARQLKHDQEAAISEMEYDNASNCKAELEKIKSTIEELQTTLTSLQTVVHKTDPITVCRCLKISRAHLRSKKVNVLSPALKIMCDEIVELLTNVDFKVRAKALECYALCCIIDEQTARKGMYIFYASMMVNTTNDADRDIDSLLISIKATIDLLLVYGSDIIPSSLNEQNKNAIFSFTDVIRMLVDSMDHENVIIQECSGKGLCKLIVNGRIFSPTLISRMILKWCNPASEDMESERLRQTIGMMLETIPKISNYGEHLETAFFLTVQTLIKAPNTSPLSKVNVFDIIKFMLQIFSMCDESLNIHKNLALKLCREIKDNPQENYIPIYTKTLLSLELLPYEQAIYNDLITLCDELRDLITNRVVLNNIIKFQAQLTDVANKIAEAA